MDEHKPALLREVLSHLPSFGVRHSCGQKRWMLDATFGRGGHTQAILKHLPSLSIIALDCDAQAIEWGAKNLHLPGSWHLWHGHFHQFPQLIRKHLPDFFQKEKGFDIVLADLGVSSPQLDQAHRGFSFYHDGPLDMRMDQTRDLSAQEIVNTWGESQLRDLFYLYGDIRSPQKVVKALVKARKKQGISSTVKLAQFIEKTVGWRKKGSHPAAPYFLALRLRVNHELENLKQALPLMIQYLKPKGRLFVISFHSLEDRIVKNVFRESPIGRPVNKKVITPSYQEIRQNPRVRSAKLRIFEK